MRGVLLSAAFAAMMTIFAPVKSFAATPQTVPVVASAPAPVVALQIPDKTIEINVGDRSTVRWYRNPVWVAIGILAVIVILLLIAMAVRGGGGGTTIVRD